MNRRHALISVRFAIAFIVAVLSLRADAQAQLKPLTQRTRDTQTRTNVTRKRAECSRVPFRRSQYFCRCQLKSVIADWNGPERRDADRISCK